MRFEMIQNSMSLLPTAALEAAHERAEREQEERDARRPRDAASGTAELGDGDDHGDQRAR